MSLTIIHLSDIHIKAKEDIVHTRVHEIACACTSVIPSRGDVVLAISGDIAFSGNKEQYQLAAEDLKSIAKYISEEKSSTIHYIFAPGNHDCDFSTAGSIRNTLVGSVKPEAVDLQYYNSVSGVQADYFSFIKEYGIDSKDLITTKEIKIDGNKIFLASINTAWMSVKNEVPGKIVMPSSLLHEIPSGKYKIVVFLFHHPEAWLNPDFKTEFVDFVRHNTDILLVGHEHLKDSYEQVGQHFSVLCNHGKELQDSNSEASAFSIINFDQTCQNYQLIDLSWNGSGYSILSDVTKPFHKNSAIYESVFHPNDNTIASANDMGISVKHFAKEEVILPDLYVWPELNKVTYHSEKKTMSKVQTNVFAEFEKNSINIITGISSSGKTALAKMLFLSYAPDDVCCIYVNGSFFKSADSRKIAQVIDRSFESQYSISKLEEFRKLSSKKRVIIVDDFDCMRLHGDRRNAVINYLADYFGKVYFLLSSDIELPMILSSTAISTLSEVFAYDILPLGNRKRKELISKWYHLHERNREEDEIETRIDNSIAKVNTFLGNGACFIPAIPVFVIGVLQNGDAMTATYNGSQYGFLYETMIQKSLSAIGQDYAVSGSYNIDVSIVSQLAFYMLQHRKTFFSEDELAATVKEFNSVKKLTVSSEDILRKMCDAKIFLQDASEGTAYKFKYPYIFYYFAGHYLAYHLNDKNVQDTIDYMSSRLYIEDYGNIIIFLCHFANNTNVIESILLNAYATLDNYKTFDFSKSEYIFSDIQSAIDAIIPKAIGNNEDVKANKEESLSRLDSAGINDGHVEQSDSIIDDEVTDKEKDLAAISASFKTLEVLGQILQNYPGEIDGKLKVDMIDELHKLGMRSVQAIIETMGYMEQDLINFVVDRATQDGKNFRREDVVSATKKFLSMLLSGMVRGMINMVAKSLNSKHLLYASKEALEKDESISSKLVLAELKTNCLKIPDYQEIASLKDQLDRSNERFASCILSSIVGYYLSYNKCDYRFRAKLCSLFDFSEKDTMLETSKRLLEQGY